MTTSPSRGQSQHDSEPLLGSDDDGVSFVKPDGTASTFTSISNLLNTILGTGMLALPHAFASGGMVPGIITVLVCGSTGWFGLYILSRCGEKTDHRALSFTALSHLTYPKLSKLFDAAIMLKCYGVSCSYLIIIGSLMPKCISLFHRSGTEVPAILLDRRFWIVAAMIFLTPLSFLRRLDSFRHISVIALFAVADLMYVVIYKSINRSGLDERAPVYMFDFGLDWISTLPVSVFAFTCAQNLCATVNELYNNSQPRVNVVLGSSIGIATGIYEVLGIVGYLTFGDRVGANIIEMYPHSTLVAIAQVAIVILVMASYPLQVHPCRAALDKIVRPKATPGSDDDEDSGDVPLLVFCAETAVILLATFVVAINVSDISVVLGFVGATGSTTISFLLPALFFISLFRRSERASDRRLVKCAVGLAVWGIAVAVVSLTTQALAIAHRR